MRRLDRCEDPSLPFDDLRGIETKVFMITPSDRPDSFTELQLPMGKKAATVEECLRGLLETERLEDSNKYFCSRCNEKHNASRRMVLKRLPDTLNLQLLRCVSAEKGKAKEWAEKREVKNMAKRAPE